MYIMSNTCPGRGWRRVQVAYIRCEVTGQTIVPGPQDTFWERVI